MKVCSCCQQEKDTSEFHKDKTSKDGLAYHCKVCAIQRSRQNYQDNKKRKAENHKVYYTENKDRIVEKVKAWCKKNPDKRFKIHRKWYEANKDEKKVKDRLRVQSMREEINESRRIKRLIDPHFRISSVIAKGIHKSLTRGKEGYHWEDLVGYTIQDLMNHLEKHFTDGMNWDNYGTWHIDHKIPLRVFNFQSFNDLDFKRAWALSNLQPMWGKDNLSKGGRVRKPFQPALAIAV